MKRTSMGMRCVALLLTLCLFLTLGAGCESSKEDSAQLRMERVIQGLYSGPTDEQREVVQAAIEDPTSEDGGLSQYQELLDTQFDPEDFTESLYEQLSVMLLMNSRVPQMCTINGYTLQPQEVEVELANEPSRDYTYTIEVEVVKEDTGEAVGTVTEEGRITLDEEGLVSNITPGFTNVTQLIQK